MKKVLMFLAGLVMTCSMTSCCPEMVDALFAPDVVVVHDGPHHHHHPEPVHYYGYHHAAHDPFGMEVHRGR